MTKTCILVALDSDECAKEKCNCWVWKNKMKKDNCDAYFITLFKSLVMQPLVAGTIVPRHV